LLGSLLILVFAGIWFTHYRSQIADAKIKNKLLSDAIELAHTLNLQMVKQLTFTDKDKNLPAYQRICQQMHAFGKLIYQKGIYSMKLVDGKIYFGPESYLEDDPDASPPGTLYEEPSQRDFEVLRTGNPAVFGPITDEYGSFISALAPVIDPLTGETLLVVGIDIPAENHEKTIRAAGYLPIALSVILFLILLTGFIMMNRRLYYEPEKKARYRYLEAALVLLSGIIVTTALSVLSTEAEKSEKEQIFNSKSYAYSDILRNAVYKIQDNIEDIDNFIAITGDISPAEFTTFVQPFASVSTAEAFFWVPLNAFPADGDKIIPDPDFTVPSSANSFLEGKNLSAEKTIRQAILHSINTHLVSSADSFRFLNSSEDKSQFIVLKSVIRKNATTAGSSRDSIMGIVAAVMDWQKTLENSFKGSGQFKEHFDANVYDLSFDQPHILASLSDIPENEYLVSFQQIEDDSRYFSRIIPLFIFGKTFAIVANSTPAFHQAYPTINGRVSMITGLIITFVLALFVSFQRNRQYFLEQSVNERTSELNQRVKELTCLNKINDELRLTQNTDTLFGKILAHLHNGMQHPGKVIPEIVIENKKYLPDNEVTDDKSIGLSEEIQKFGVSSGTITIYLRSQVSFLDEEQNMLKHSAQLISRWLERKEAETISHKRESELKAFLNASTESIFLIDVEGLIITANEESSRRFKTPLNNLIGANIFAILPDSHALTSRAKVKELVETGSPVRYELEQSGRIFYISLSPVRNQDNEITNIAVFGIDITERKKIETELKKAIEKVEASDQLKTAFLNNISHEVRTPLNGILGFADIITQPGLSQAEIDQCLDILQVSSKRLVDTINDYMDMSLIVSGNMHIFRQPFFLSKTFLEVNDSFAPFSHAKNLELKLEIPESETNLLINQDEELVRKVLCQLMDNAIKFSSKGAIRHGFTLKKGFVQFYVKDEGIGINTEALGRIFENFQQEDVSRTRQHEGSGLGLSIAKGIINLMGGTIHVKSVKGQGSTFYFTLPVNPDQNPVPESVSDTFIGAQPEQPTIMIAEDDESSFLYLESVFKKKDIQLLRAKNGISAVELCREHPEIALVLMDLKMPLMDGFEATRQIKTFRNNLPVFAITAFALSGDERKALEAGCDEYLAKPLKAGILMKKIEKYKIFIGD